MKKRIFAAMAATLVAATALAACGGSNSGSTGDSGKTSTPASTADSGKTETGTDNGAALDASAQAIADRTETQTVVVNWMTWSGAPKDLQLVVDGMNELTVPALNLEVEMQVTDYASRSQQLTLSLSGGETIDIMGCLGLGYATAVQNDYLIDLEENDLLYTYGQDIIDTMGQEFIDACRMNGVLYGLPNQRDMAQGRQAICVRTDILKDACESIGVTPDLESETWFIGSWDEIVDIIKAMHDTHPEVTSYKPGDAFHHLPFD